MGGAGPGSPEELLGKAGAGPGGRQGLEPEREAPGWLRSLTGKARAARARRAEGPEH